MVEGHKKGKETDDQTIAGNHAPTNFHPRIIMKPLTNHFPTALWASYESPCLSFYQPTHRFYPDNQQDRIRYRNQLKDLENSLRRKYPNREVRPLLEPFHHVALDDEFWRHTLDGLAIFSAQGLFEIFRLQHTVPELALAATTFHTKPLLSIFQAVDRYQVLCLDQKKIKLLEGHRDILDEVDLAPGVPRTLEEALGDQLTEPQLRVSTYGLGPATGDVPMFHGQGGRKDEVDVDMERFFRAVDRALLESHSKPSGLPLLLAALPENQAHFRKFSQNPNLVAEGVSFNPDSLSQDELRECAWRVMEPAFEARMRELIEKFQTAQSRKKGSDDLAAIALEAIKGRVDTLLIDQNRHVPGRIDEASGRIELAHLEHPDIDDLLDDLGELVMKKGGQAIVLPSDRMPTPTGAAAIYRY